MKKCKSTAILMASAMMLSLVGCSGSSDAASSGSSAMELTEAELRQAAREAMIASEAAEASSREDASAASSSIDAATAASSDVATIAGSSDVAATTLNSSETLTTTSTATATTTNGTTTTGVATATTPDAATAGSSAPTVSTTDSNTTATTEAANAIPAKLADHEFVYNGKVHSVLNSTNTIMSNLGQYQSRNTSCPEQPFYSYDGGSIIFITGIKDGNELPVDIAVYKKGILTARGVGVGSTLAEINNAYNGCNKSSFSLNKDYGISVKFDAYTLCFYFNTKNDTVVSYAYDNNDTLSKMYPVKSDIADSTKNIVATGKAQATTSSSNATTATNTTTSNSNANATPAANNTAPAQTTNNVAPAPAATTTQNSGSISEAEIMYNGKKLSILDGASTLMANLGQCEKKDTSTADEPRYVYDSNNINLYTFVNNGEELTYDLCIYKQGAKTSRNVGVGDSKDKIIAAYGSPAETYSFYQGYGFKYKFDTFTLYFDFDTNTDKVYSMTYGNNDTIRKRHAAHPNYIGD